MKGNPYVNSLILVFLLAVLGLLIFYLFKMDVDSLSPDSQDGTINETVLKSMMWAIIPMMLTLFLMEFYFSHHPNEELGWNTAFGNSLMILFISFGLFGRLVENEIFSLNMPTAFASLLLLSGILLTIIDFLKLLPSNLAFGFSSSLTVNSFGIITILVVYTAMSFTLTNIIYLIFLLFTIFALTKMIHIFTEKKYVETEEEKIENMKYENICLEYLRNGVKFSEIRKKFREAGLTDSKISYLFGIILSRSYQENKLSYENYLFSRRPSSFKWV